MNLSNTWKHYYQSLSSNEDVNKNFGSFSIDSVFSPAVDFGAKIKANYIKDMDSIILAKAPGSFNLTMYHIIANLGGSRSKRTNKYVSLLVFGIDTTAVIFDEASIVAAIEEACPAAGLLKKHFREHQRCYC